MGLGQEQLTQNKLSIVNSIHNTTSHSVSRFDNIPPQIYMTQGEKKRRDVSVLVLGSLQLKRSLFLFQEIQPYSYTYSNHMAHRHWFEMLLLEIILES